uniref:Crumbs homolog 3b n=1 Tax=Dicentrarchus labrax TaxID=13489 RepID=A0A8C4NQI9_DICLA
MVLSGVIHLLTPLTDCVLFPPQLFVTMAMQVIIPPTVSVFVSTVLSLLSLALLLLLCVIRKKRRMEGMYRPSAEERKQTGAAGSEKPGLPLPLPKEERLI